MSEDCITTVTDKILVFSDKKSKCEFRIINDKQRKIEKHRVDGCRIKGEENKCDWLAVDVESDKEFFIELKGKDIEHALKQLCASADKLSKNKASKKLAYVISTRSPLNSAKIDAISKKILGSHKLVLIVKTIKHSENIEKMIAALAS